jgi:hypothetical protein
MPRVAKHPETLRHELLACTELLFFERGYGEVTSGTLMPEFHVNEDHGHGI